MYIQSGIFRSLCAPRCLPHTCSFDPGETVVADHDSNVVEVYFNSHQLHISFIPITDTPLALSTLLLATHLPLHAPV
jgi:hypothetical protein